MTRTTGITRAQSQSTHQSASHTVRRLRRAVRSKVQQAAAMKEQAERKRVDQLTTMARALDDIARQELKIVFPELTLDHDEISVEFKE